MFLVIFVPDVLVELLKQDLCTLLGTYSTIVPCGDILLNYFKSCTVQDKSKSSAGWISSGTVFLVFCCHFFFQAIINNNNNNKSLLTYHGEDDVKLNHQP
jgi:hypothetical protein